MSGYTDGMRLAVILGPWPDPMRTFVQLGHAETVHEVHPIARWRMWRARTLCGRPLHTTGRIAPRSVRARSASCHGCQSNGKLAAVACAILRWGEALAART